ncbi:hypothetical protein TNCV_3241751 [Trichonephila clavipes]|nr:hypothetical protein TNCV_3241751 [Trichonephila clavipes]
MGKKNLRKSLSFGATDSIKKAFSISALIPIGYILNRSRISGISSIKLGMQPKAKHSLRAQAQLSETKTETMRTETVETFELVKVEPKLLREEKGERERCASRRYLLHIIVKLIC